MIARIERLAERHPWLAALLMAVAIGALWPLVTLLLHSVFGQPSLRLSPVTVATWAFLALGLQYWTRSRMR